MNRAILSAPAVFAFVASIAATGSLAWNIVQQTEIKRLTMIKEVVNQKESLLNDSLNEIVMSRFNEMRDSITEVSRNQGRVEGMLSVAMNLPPEQNLTSSVWHDGYYRGQSQTEFVEEMAYTKGYHQATEDMNCPPGSKAKAADAAINAYKKEKEQQKGIQEEAKKEFDSVKKIKEMEEKQKEIDQKIKDATGINKDSKPQK
jgi:hypothetical protein